MGAFSRRDFLKTVGLGLGAFCFPGAGGKSPVFGAENSAERPNIIVILSDDMGFSDIGCYGGEISTPNLDKLAENGLRFKQFYNTARCCPTRACLLTGLYPHQAAVGHMMENKGLDGFQGELSSKAVTIAEALKPAGYSTYCVGKWHVTTNPDKHNWPLQRGFDRFYGTIHGAGSFFDPNTLTRDNAFISPYADPEYKPDSYYYTDAIGDHGVRFIADHCKSNKDKPFFMYVAFTAAHWPMHALENDIAKYKGRYDAGYGPIRKARCEGAKKLGLVKEGWELSEQAEGWDSVEDKAWESRCMEVYAAMISAMDRNVGKLVDQLRSTGQLDNTLVFFLQDNGACAELLGRGNPEAPRADHPTLPPLAADYLQPDMRPRQTRDGHPVRSGRGVMPGGEDTWVAYGRGWANVSNTPFREYKHWVHEGGISTPLIAHWPGRIKRKGVLEQQPGHLIDVMATCVDVAGVKYPAEFGGQKIKPMEGCSLVPAFDGKPIERKNPLFWEHEGNRAIRTADQWKLVAKGPQGNWELYNMEKDRTEMHDLAGEMPDKVKEMASMWEDFAKRADAVPWPWGKPYGEDKKPGKGEKKNKKKR